MTDAHRTPENDPHCRSRRPPPGQRGVDARRADHTVVAEAQARACVSASNGRRGRLGLWLRRIAALGIVGLVGAAAVAWWIVGQVYAPRLYPIGPPPADLDGRSVTFASVRSGASPSGSNTRLRGWLFPGWRDAGLVLMHGSGGDRRSMLGRASFLHRAGYAVLIFDFQANGESPGPGGTDGYLESRDAQAAVDFLRRETGVAKVGVIGFSLGGAAALLGPAGPLEVDAMVLEAVYPTIEEAIANRIRQRLGPWSGRLYPLFTWQTWPRLGISPRELRPIARIGLVHAPVFVIGGDADPNTPPEESRRLFDATLQPKQFWLVPGAGHEDFHAAAPQEYERRVLAFLGHTLVGE
jgi:fermentation-respiration switch protein FrsA (DUF1100 family)